MTYKYHTPEKKKKKKISFDLEHIDLRQFVEWYVWIYRFEMYIYLLTINLRLFIVHEKAMVDGLHANVMIVVGCPCSLSDIDNLNFVCFAWLNDFMIAHMVLLLSLEI